MESAIGKNQLYTFLMVGVFVTLIFIIVSMTQKEITLGTQIIFLPILGLWMGLQCNAIITHNFGYLRHQTINPRSFIVGVHKYWKALPVTLILVFLAFILNYWLGLVVAFIVVGSMKKKLTVKHLEEYMEGTRLEDFDMLYQRLLEQKESQSFYFGGLWLPRRELVTHAKIIGSAGSGKTNILRLYMQSILRDMGSPAYEDRALIFDPKSEFYPFFRGMGIPEEYITVLNPFDARACAWDMAADLCRPRDAATLANTMIPEKEGGNSGNNDFFDKAARRVLSGLTKFFIRYAPGRWTLRDIVLGAQSVELVGLLAGSDRKLMRDLQVLGAGDTAGNVVATLAAVIGDELETIAAYLDYHHQQGRTFSLNQWFEGSSILLLGCDRESEATLKPYNQLLVKRFCELATSSNRLGMSHAIFDELPALGKMGEKLDELARLGRSYQVPVVIAFQAYSSLKHLYGEHVANALIGQCDKSAYLRVVDRESAQWASDQIGQIKKRVFRQGTSVGTSTTPDKWGKSVSVSHSQQEQVETEPAVSPEDIMNLTKPSKEAGNGVMGFYKVAENSYNYYLTSSLLSKIAVTDDPISVGYAPVQDTGEAEELRLWESDDLERLGIDGFMQNLEASKLKSLPISELTADCLEAVPSVMTAALEESKKD